MSPSRCFLKTPNCSSVSTAPLPAGSSFGGLLLSNLRLPREATQSRMSTWASHLLSGLGVTTSRAKETC